MTFITVWWLFTLITYLISNNEFENECKKEGGFANWRETGLPLGGEKGSDSKVATKITLLILSFLAWPILIILLIRKKLKGL